MIETMNSQFTDEQIKAYASAFREGDTIWAGGKWCEVIRDRSNSLITRARGNGYVINFGEKGVDEYCFSFKKDAIAQTPYRVTTREHYRLRGGGETCLVR